MGISPTISAGDIISVLAFFAIARHYSMKIVNFMNNPNGNPSKINHLCKIVEKNEIGEWNRSGKWVRMGSKDYAKALGESGVALRHRDDRIEEGLQ